MKIDSIMVGPIMTNCYLLSDETAGACALIDPGDEADRVLDMVSRSGCALQYILLTHGHFDHTTAVRPILERYPDLPVYINEKDVVDGRRGDMELVFSRLPEHNQRYYHDGDTLFRCSCGRTDFAGGDWREMLRSLGRLGNLPGPYRVYPGHDQPTTLDYERRANPYVRQGMK